MKAGRMAYNDEMRKIRIACSKEYLRTVLSAKSKADATKAATNALIESMGVKGIDYSAVRSSHAANGDAIPDGLAKVHESIVRYATEIADYAKLMDEAKDIIMSIDDGRQSNVLTRYYLCGQSMADIAAAIGYSYDSVRVFKDDGLANIYDSIPHTFRIPAHPAL